MTDTSNIRHRKHIPMYMATMTEAIASGDLAKMKTVAGQAEEHLATYGDIPGLLQQLKVEIAKAEAKGG